MVVFIYLRINHLKKQSVCVGVRARVRAFVYVCVHVSLCMCVAVRVCAHVSESASVCVCYCKINLNFICEKSHFATRGRRSRVTCTKTGFRKSSESLASFTPEVTSMSDGNSFSKDARVDDNGNGE